MPTEVIGFSGIGIINGCGVPCGSWGLVPGLLQEKPVFLTFEPSLQPLFLLFFVYFPLSVPGSFLGYLTNRLLYSHRPPPHTTDNLALTSNGSLTETFRSFLPEILTLVTSLGTMSAVFCE